MIDRIGARADQVIERIIVGQVDRMAVAKAKPRKRRAGSDSVHQPNTLAQHSEIGGIAQEVRVDGRRCDRIARGKPDRTAAFGTQHAGVARNAPVHGQLAAMIFEHGRDEMKLHVGCGQIRRRPPEAAGLGHRAGQHACAAASMFEEGSSQSPQASWRKAYRIAREGSPVGDEIDMVVQVGPDLGTFMHNIDPVVAEMLPRADA